MPSPRQTFLLLGGAILLPGFLPSCDCFSAREPGGQAEAESQDPYEGTDRGEWLSMAVMPDGSPAVAFYNRSQGGLEFATGHVSEDGTVSWTYEQVDGFPDADGLDTGQRGEYASLAIAPDGTVWIGYRDADNGALRYARRTAHLQVGPGHSPTDPVRYEWETGVADAGSGPSPDAGYWASIALDPDNRPVIAHYDAAKGQLRVAHWADTGFSAEVVDEGEDFEGDTGETRSADVGRYVDLAIADDGTEYLAYYDAAWGRLQLAVGSSGAYTVYTVDDEGDVGQWPSILLEGDQLAIAYQDVGNQDLKLARGTPSTFDIQTIDDGEYAGADTALFRFGDNLAVLYFSGLENDLRLASWTGSSWNLQTLAGDDAALGFHNEVISVGGHHYAACYDYTNRQIWFQALD